VVGARMEGDRGGGKGIIFYLEKNHEMSFAWGNLGIMYNNQAGPLSILQGLKILSSRGIDKLNVIRDSTIPIGHLRNQSNSKDSNFMRLPSKFISAKVKKIFATTYVQ
jgi:ribonuclease HI